MFKIKKTLNLLAAVCIIALISAGSATAYTAEQLKTIIQNYGLSAEVSGTTVTVTGTKLNATEGLSLYIDEGVTVSFRAKLTSSENNLHLITLQGNEVNQNNGAGIFSIDEGADIQQTNGFAAIVSIPHASKGITVNITGGNISVSGGSNGGYAYLCNGISYQNYTNKLNISGGNIYAENTTAIMGSGTISVSGGQILAKSTDRNYRTNAFGNGVSISGTAVVVVLGGRIAYSGISGEINATPIENALTIAWYEDGNEPLAGFYLLNESRNLTVKPATANAKWTIRNEDGKNGIFYISTPPTIGFIEVDGIDIIDGSDAVDISNEFSDPNFCAAIRDYLGLGEEEPILDIYTSVVKVLNVSSADISSLEGIEHFTALEELWAYGNQITDLDLSQNSNITLLSIGENGLSGFDAAQLPNLKYLYLSENNLTELDLSQNTVLEELDAENNALTGLDLSANSALKYLYVSENNLTELNLSNNPVLEELSLYNNKLAGLDLSQNTVLKSLAAYDNALIGLDLSANSALEYLYLNNNKLSELDLSNNPALEDLEIAGNSLTSVDVSALTNLGYFNCAENFLSELDLSNAQDLWYLDVSYNRFVLNEESGLPENITSAPTVDLEGISFYYTPQKIDYDDIFSEGNGTAVNPYLIMTAKQLADFAEKVNSGYTFYDEYLKLGTDIDLSSFGSENAWEIEIYDETIIGKGWIPVFDFEGTFDGNGKRISNLFIETQNDSYYFGFFTYNYGTIQNLTLEDVNITTAYSCGALAGYNEGNILNSAVVGGTVKGVYSGGLVYQNDGRIENCYSIVNVEGNETSGGLVNHNSGTIINCYSAGEVSEGTLLTGGLIAENYGDVEYSYYDSETSGQSDDDRGEPKSTAEMKSQSTYENWDFESIWEIDEAHNGGYPMFMRGLLAEIPSGLTAVFGETLADVELPSGWSWAAETSTLVGDAGDRTHKAHFSGTRIHKPIRNADLVISVDKISGNFDFSEVINITYTETLILGDLTLPDNYNWLIPETALNAGENQQFEAEYTDPSGNFHTASGLITVNVAKAAGIWVPVEPLTKVYVEGLTLGNIELPSGYSWENPAIELSISPAAEYDAIMSAADDNHLPAAGKISVTITDETTPIIDSDTKSDSRFGIKFMKNIVNDKAEIFISEKCEVRSVKLIVYDITGNVVFETKVAGEGFQRVVVWDLTNSAGRTVANGSYLVIAEVKTQSGKIYNYSAKLGVKR